MMKSIVKSSKQDKTAIKLANGNWYNLKGEALITSKSEELYNKTVEFELDNEGKDIVKIKVIAEAQNTPFKQENTGFKPRVKDINESKRITRQNSLTQANKLLETLISNNILKNVTTNDIQAVLFEVAEKCNEWIWHDHETTTQKSINPDRDKVVGESVGEFSTSFSPQPPISISDKMRGIHQAFLLTKPLGDNYGVKEYVYHMTVIHGLSRDEAEAMYYYYETEKAL